MKLERLTFSAPSDEATVPQVVRASFGEFYTPYWLAGACARIIAA